MSSINKPGTYLIYHSQGVYTFTFFFFLVFTFIFIIFWWKFIMKELILKIGHDLWFNYTVWKRFNKGNRNIWLILIINVNLIKFYLNIISRETKYESARFNNNVSYCYCKVLLLIWGLLLTMWITKGKEVVIFYIQALDSFLFFKI